MSTKETVAILGGTGDLGTGLAIRWSKAGYKIVIGSRTQEKADEAVAALKAISPDTPAEAMENDAAAKAGDVVVLTVPAAHQISTLDAVKDDLKGKILIDVTVPLVPPKVGTVQMPEEGSAGKRAQDFLGEDVHVVSAFQNIAAHLLQQDVKIECDVLVAGNSKDARTKVIEMIQEADMTGWHAGPIANAAAAEALTSILIQINRSGIVSHSGIKDHRSGTLSTMDTEQTEAPQFRVIGLPGIGMIERGDDLVAAIVQALEQNGLALEHGDVVCVAQKIISKAEGCLVSLSDVEPTEQATELADGDPQRSSHGAAHSRRVQ